MGHLSQLPPIPQLWVPSGHTESPLSVACFYHLFMQQIILSNLFLIILIMCFKEMDHILLFVV